MPNEDDIAREVRLEAQKAELVESIMAKCPDEITLLLGVMESLYLIRKRREPVKPEDYSGYRQPIEAVIKYLETVGTPMTRPAVIKAVVERGFGPYDEQRERNIRAAIDYAVNTSKKLILTDKKYVGLPEWK